jgi:sugar phosphate isomerase/epimerase
MNRRTFVGTALAGLAAGELSSPVCWAMPEHKLQAVGLQLYTVRNNMKSDFAGTLAKVAQVGYQEVEFAGYYDKTPKEVADLLKTNGLTSPSCHVDYDIVENQWSEQLDKAHIIGHKYIVCPWIDEKQRTADGMKRAAELFQKAGEQSLKGGIEFAYHNHTFEFQKAPGLDGKVPYDLLLATDAKFVKFEMDLCWISVAGRDPVEYFEKYPGRFPLVHVKDMKQLPKGDQAATASPETAMANMTEVGSGVIDFKRIFRHSEKAGIKHYFVEHDFPKDPFESIAQSHAYLSKLTF